MTLGNRTEQEAPRPRLDPLEFAQWADRMRRDYGDRFHVYVDSNRQVVTLTATVWRTQ